MGVAGASLLNSTSTYNSRPNVAPTHQPAHNQKDKLNFPTTTTLRYTLISVNNLLARSRYAT